jgi:hypothetical protein
MLQWQKEYGRANELPSAWSTLLLFAVLTVVLLAALGVTEVELTSHEQPPTLCQEHAGRPGWAAVCDPQLVKARP